MFKKQETIPFDRLAKGDSVFYESDWLAITVKICEVEDTLPHVEVEVEAPDTELFSYQEKAVTSGMMLGTCSFDHLKKFALPSAKGDQHIDSPLSTVARPEFGYGDVLLIQASLDGELAPVTFPVPKNVGDIEFIRENQSYYGTI